MDLRNPGPRTKKLWTPQREIEVDVEDPAGPAQARGETREQLIQRYRTLRDIMFDLGERALSGPRWLTEDHVEAAAAGLGFLGDMEGGKRVLLLPDESAQQHLIDFALHEDIDMGLPVLQQMRHDLAGSLSPDEARILAAAASSRFSAYMITGSAEGTFTDLRDLFRIGRPEEHVRIVDIQLSSRPLKGLVVLSRIIQIDGLAMTTGTGLPVTRSEDLERIFQVEPRLLDEQGPDLLGAPPSPERRRLIAHLLGAGFRGLVERRSESASYRPPNQTLDPDEARRRKRLRQRTERRQKKQKRKNR